MENGSRAGAEGRDVVGDDLQAAYSVLDEVRLTRAARQRFETERSRSGKKIEDVCIGQRIVDDAHPRFADAIFGGHYRIPRRRLDLIPAPRAGDDAHVMLSGAQRGSWAPS